MMRLAVQASTTKDAEPAGWAYARLGGYQLQGGNTKEAAWSAQRALELVPDFPAALVLQARVLASEGKNTEAVPVLQRAVTAAPLPENQWFLADVARAAGNEKLAVATEEAIRQRGKAEDPRSFALYSATRNQDAQEALRVARAELGTRKDIFTHDAIAWAALSAGDLIEAKSSMERALAEKTNDARLYYHAGKIALATGDAPRAHEFFAKSAAIQQTLLPSERADLTRVTAVTTTAVPPIPFTADNKPMAISGRN